MTTSEEVSPEFHSRFSGKGKRYRYLIHAAPHAGALNRLTHAHVIYPLNVEAMRAEARDLIGTHDFGAFAASGSVVKDTVRTIWRADIQQNGTEIALYVEGNGFLYNMCRAMVGTMVYASYGKLVPEEIPALLEKRDRRLTGPTMPPQGLYLNRVWYDGAAGTMMEKLP